MWLALTQSWCVLSKMTGYVSLGHVVFYGLGAYLVVVTWQSWPLPLAIAAAGALAALFAALVGLPVLRVRGPYFVILTFGVAELVKYSILAAEAASGTASRILFGAPDLIVIYFAMFALAAAATLLLVLVEPLALRPRPALAARERGGGRDARRAGGPLQAARVRALGGDPRHGRRGHGVALDLLRRRPGVRSDDLGHGDRHGAARRRRRRARADPRHAVPVHRLRGALGRARRSPTC